MASAFKAWLFAAASATALASTAARAADAPAPAQVQEIVVTAQKREQKEIDVPITLTAYSGAFLSKLGVQDIHDLSLLTPGFFLQNQSVNDPGLVMRGITTDSTDPTDEPRVSVYQDGVSISQIPAAAVELFDNQRVEVAKGPQTTLFGRSALTGAVNIIQNKASESGLDWSLHAEGGNYDYGYVEGMLNIPVGDTFAVRLSGVDKTRDGYVKNELGGTLNGSEAQALRLALNYRPNDSLNDDLIANYERDKPGATDFKNTTFYPSNPTTGQVLGNLEPNSSAALGSSPALNNNAPLGVIREIQGVANILTWRLNPAFKLTSTTAWRHFTSEEIYDPDGFSFPLLSGSDNSTGTEYSQDFRLNYDPGGKVSVFGGASVFDDYGRQNNSFVIDEPHGRADLGLHQRAVDGGRAAGAGRSLWRGLAGGGGPGHRQKSQSDKLRTGQGHQPDPVLRPLSGRDLPPHRQVRSQRRRPLHGRLQGYLQRRRCEQPFGSGRGDRCARPAGGHAQRHPGRPGRARRGQHPALGGLPHPPVRHPLSADERQWRQGQGLSQR
jgi:outer membrane receptor protein involved in Fe transport